MDIQKVGLQAKTAFVYGTNDLGEERLILTCSVDINETEAETLDNLKQTGNRFIVGSDAYKNIYVTFEDRYE